MKKTGWIVIALICGLFLIGYWMTARSKPTEQESAKTEPAQGESQTTQAAAQPNQPAAEQSPTQPAAENQPSQPEESRRSRFSRRGEGFGGFGGFGDRGPRPGEMGRSDPNQPGDGLESVQLNDMEMKNILKILADWTNKPVIPVNDEIMQTRITVYSPKRVTREEALALLVSALHSRGVLVDQTGSTIFLKPLASARLGAVPTLGVDEPLARISDPAQVVEKWYQLSNYKASQMAQIVSSLTAEYGHVTADEATGRISVIDTVENLRRIEQVILQLDVPESSQTVERIFELKYADPIEVVQVLNLILGQTAQTQRTSSSQGGFRGPGRGREGTQTTTPAAPAVVIPTSEIPIRLIAMPKQHWILARCSREDMQTVESWIQKLDIGESTEPKQQVFQIRYADVREVATMVTQALREMPGTDLTANLIVQPLQGTNQIVVFGSDENRKIVEKLIAQIDLPKEDIYIERTFKLKHADPDQIKQNIEGLYETEAGTLSSYSWGSSRTTSRSRTINPEETVKVISYPTLRQVTVIASEKNMQRIAKQIEEEWDIPLDLRKDQYRIITLQNSDAVKMADLLTRLFSEESESSGSRSLLRILFGEQEQTKGKIVGSLYGMLTFEAVPDTKKILVISKIPEAYDVIERLVQDLDGQEGAEVPRVVTLKYADAEQLSEQLNAILNEAGTTATIQRSVQGLSAYSTESTSTTTTEAQMQESAGTIRPWWTTQRQSEDQMPPSNLIGRVRFIPVARSKALLVLAPPKFMDDILKMIEQLDQPGMQVMIKVVIMEIDHSDVTSLGVRLSSDPSAFGTIGVNAVDILNNLTATYSRQSFALSAESNADLLIDFLVKNANAKILNQPTLWTKDNEEARFVKAQKVAFITGDSYDRTNTNSVQRTFDFEDVGVTLRIRPNITPEKAVDMAIHLNISQLQEEIVNTQPTRKNLDTMTHMIVNDGQSVILGGLLFQNDVSIVQKVPLLGDLPLVGGLFKHNNIVLQNDELLVFVTPYVIDERGLAQMPTESEEERNSQIYQPHSKVKTQIEQMQENIRQRFLQDETP
ncbi:MAG TPA: secretin N-terminal domain-containing protein [Anaerohalosphaeraceae bacterium]|nr:secretin N-terminal domain-containing protein [Anaerohalosphaeraceae bacterium]HOL89754.1 secretin N-terminal domain-containing protein [Anaerohalosphaeraceae bacterium]HPP57206.1 secretin N-terminal domain-containing protein [Anaerohalosphaeraceae bacterium]